MIAAQPLYQVIEFYNRGGNPNSYLDPELHPLELTAEEKHAVIAFLKALSGTIYETAEAQRFNSLSDEAM